MRLKPLDIIAITLSSFAFVLMLGFSVQADAQVKHIDNQQLNSLIDEGVPVVDLRTAAEWRHSGIIEGSHLLTFFDERGNYDVRSWLEQFVQVARQDDAVVIICAVGNRSLAVSGFLYDNLGFKKVHNVVEGIEHWKLKGFPVVPWPSIRL